MESIDDVDDNPQARAWHLLFLGKPSLIYQATEVLTRLHSIEPQVSITALRDDWLGWNVPGETLEKFPRVGERPALPIRLQCQRTSSVNQWGALRYRLHVLQSDCVPQLR
jgi:hypothetical protein